MFQSLCRLCLGAQNLVCVFDAKLSNDMPEMVQISTGVEIKKSDLVTQMICSTCCQITIKIYKFRMTSLNNDKELKARSVAHRVSELSNSSKDCTNMVTTPSPKPIVEESIDTVKSSNKQAQLQDYKGLHFSIKAIFKTYPNVRLPPECFKWHIGAYITLLSNEVDEWYKEKNYSEEEIALFKKEALEKLKKVEPVETSNSKGIPAENVSQTTKRKQVLDSKNTSKRMKLNKCTDSQSKEKDIEKLSSNKLTQDLIHNSKTEHNYSISIGENVTLTCVKFRGGASGKSEILADRTNVNSPYNIESVETTDIVNKNGDHQIEDAAGETTLDICNELRSETDSFSDNIPDSTLWSLVKKSKKLHACKVCDKHYTKQKDLEQHEQKIHMTCSFCSKTFRTPAIRAEHMNYFCLKNKSRKVMKEVKVILAKVDMDQAIRDQYPNAFESDSYRDETTDNCEATEIDNQSYEPPTEVKSTVEENVIYLSDDESKSTDVNNDNSLTSIIKIVNSDIFSKIDVQGNDVYILRQVLNFIQMKKKANVSLGNCCIINGVSKRTKIFKNLNKHLHYYKVPVEINVGSDVKVRYTSNTETPEKAVKLWNKMSPIVLKEPGSISKPVPGNYTSISVSTNQPVINNSLVYHTTNATNQVPLTTFPGCEEKVLTSNKLVITSGSITKTIPIVINSNQSMCGSANTGNFIVMPTTVIQKRSPHSTLPIAGGTCVQPITTSLTTIGVTNKLLSVKQGDNLIPQPVARPKEKPGIRVKNLKELS